MATYTPTQGKIVNGRVADADDIMSEFSAIAQTFQTAQDETERKTQEALKTAKAYADVKMDALQEIDGGTF